MRRLWGAKLATASQFACRLDGDELVLELLDGSIAVATAEWDKRRPDLHLALTEVRALLEDDASSVAGVEPHLLRLSPNVVARLDASTSSALSLPPPTKLALDLSPKGGIQASDFVVVSRWVRPGGAAERVSLHGAVLKSAQGLQRIPEPLFSLFRAARALSTPIDDEADRYRAIAELKAQWPEDPDLAVESDVYLRDLRIHYASAASVKLTALTPETTEFDPILFGSRAVADSEGEDRQLDEDLDALLPESAQRLFAKTRFYASDGAKAAYVLGKGEYVYVDPSVRPILGAIRRLQGSPEGERRAFILNPVGKLRERLGDQVADKVGLERLFVETEQFSDRVAGVDVWRKPVLPWLSPLGKNQWIPERFGLRIGDDYFVVSTENAPELYKRVEEAYSAGAPTVQVGDLLVPSEDVGAKPPTSIAVNEQTRAAVTGLSAFGLSGAASDTEASPPPLWDAATQGKLFLVVRDNFENVEFTSLHVDEDGASDIESILPPSGLQTSLKKHQTEGLEWLARSATVGRPGALLADDMGLGKTLQAITFMAWLQAEADAGRREAAPILIVAPTGLLGNWQGEILKHLEAPWLGPLARVFGGDLKRLREESGLEGRDIETGRAALDSGAWRHAGVVLTTYETLRDYHFSFARTRFGLIIYDEIQKLKNPASQVTRAAKTLNADFVLGMTGTPVENRLQDLWSLMDVIAPGLLGSSKDFEKRHPPGDREALKALKAQLMDGDKRRPPFMVRRLKSDALEGLPRKTIVPYRVEMPPRQAQAYKDVVVRAAAASASGTLGKGGMLTFLAAMRGVSLHPQDPRELLADLGSYSSDSARVTCALEIIDAARAKNEKVLVFVEDLAMQDRFSSLVQARYGLSRPPMRINGGVPGPSRQKMVDLFQEEADRFDVMILSPKAGGVGLTITAANHVIHLSRWWNPAVEDQATDRVYRIGQAKDVFVHIPLAIHPDPSLAPSSFDLRLDALIERKRSLTRDLFLPGEADDSDLTALFADVSLGGRPDADELIGDDDSAPEGSVADIAQGKPSGSGQSADAPAPLPAEAEAAGARVWICAPREARPLAEILNLFRGKTVRRATISNPYALASAAAREAQIQFASDLAGVATLKSVVVEYAPEVGDEFDDSGARRAIGSLFAVSQAARNGATFMPLRRPKRSRDDDFHDRQIALEIEGPGGTTRVHTLLIGRGVEALYDDRWQCSVSYAPPT